MKFLALFAAGAVASTVSDISAALASINTAAGSLDTAIKAIQGPQDENAVVSASGNVLSAISSAISVAQAVSPTPLGFQDALNLTPSVNALAATVSQAISDIIAKKSIIDQAGLAGVALDQLSKQQAAASSLVSVIVAQITQPAQGIASGIAAPIVSYLASGVSAYQGDTNTAAAGSSSSSAGSSTSAASSASSTAASSSSSSGTAVVITSGYATSSATSAPTSSSHNSTGPVTSSPPYTGGAAINVASFGVLALGVLVAAF